MCPTKPDGFGSKFGARSVGLNIGEVLRGDRITISDYELVMGRDDSCKHLCDRAVTPEALHRAKMLVRNGYVVEWLVLRSCAVRGLLTVRDVGLWTTCRAPRRLSLPTSRESTMLPDSSLDISRTM